MKCPFLKEARVRYCDKSAIRKMIRVSEEAAQESCATPLHRDCAVYQRFADDSDDEQCPYLRESPAQYCAAATVPKLIPYSDALLSRCGQDRHRYCDVYLGAPQAKAAACTKRDYAVGEIRFPKELYYAANHMWLDCGKHGACYVGVDGFLSRVLGSVERITYVTQAGVDRPNAVLTVKGTDLQVVFPNAMLLVGSNLYLRANPQKLTGDPYGAGWLFEGVQLPGQPPVTSGLIRGEAIQPWVEHDIARMSAFLARRRNSGRGQRLMQDGGVFSPDALTQLNREETLRLFHEFFWGFRA